MGNGRDNRQSSPTGGVSGAGGGTPFIYRACNKSASGQHHSSCEEVVTTGFSLQGSKQAVTHTHTHTHTSPVKGRASSSSPLSLKVDRFLSHHLLPQHPPLDTKKESLHVLSQSLHVCCPTHVLGQNLLETREHSGGTFQGRPRSGLITLGTHTPEEVLQGQSATVPVTRHLASFPFCGSGGSRLPQTPTVSLVPLSP